MAGAAAPGDAGQEEEEVHPGGAPAGVRPVHEAHPAGREERVVGPQVGVQQGRPLRRPGPAAFESRQDDTDEASGFRRGSAHPAERDLLRPDVLPADAAPRTRCVPKAVVPREDAHVVDAVAPVEEHEVAPAGGPA